MSQPYVITWSAPFTRAARKFFSRHRDLSDRFSAVLDQLRVNPFAPSLRLHPLAGDLAGLHAVSLTYTYRITLYLHIKDTQIVLVGIGTHDEVYG
ncbi:MAG: plasmid stabilization protein [Kiritimatiellae bacterium]|nr:plasmid stabilization protein [Kiritimatiellia bacterium]